MLTNFIPELWAARLQANLNKNLVVANLCNRDYEGEIRQMGDTVHIFAPKSLTISAYTRGTDMSVLEDATTNTAADLVIDKANYYNFFVDDVDKIQARADTMDAFMAEAAYGLADQYEQDIIAEMVANGTSGGALTGMTPAKAYEAIVDIKTAMDNANVTGRRWLLVDPAFEGLMLKDPRFVTAGVAESENRLQNGIVARAAGFDIYKSNNVTGKLIAGVSSAVATAEQLLKTEAYRPEKKFADAVKGLHVYGNKVVNAAGVRHYTYSI